MSHRENGKLQLTQAESILKTKRKMKNKVRPQKNIISVDP